MTNAQVRIAHPNPVVRIKWVTMTGRTMPPMLEPVKRMPNAAPRFLVNQPAAQETAGQVRMMMESWSCTGSSTRLKDH
jgi:hypothetical protein